MTTSRGEQSRIFRVFLSSPGDVVDERWAALELLSALQRKPRYQDRDVAVTVVAWDDPAAPVPRFANQNPQLTIGDYKLRPSQCDLTIAILWSRLGTLLPERHFPKAEGGAYESGTAWEIADAEQSGKLVLMFCSQVPLPRKRTADQIAATKAVDEFIADKIRAADGALRGGVYEYDDIDDFRTKLEQAVEQWLDLQLKYEVGSNLTRALEPTLSGSRFIPPNIKPNLPDKWVRRPEVDALVSRLLGAVDLKLAVTSTDPPIESDSPSTTRTSSTRTALRGGGGFGKTSLAIAICHDARMVEAFSDGILWISFGQNPDVPSLLNEQLRRLTGLDVAVDPLAAASALRELLADKRILVVLDDIWEERHVRPFLVPSQGVTVLTTRIRSLPAKANAAEFVIERMDNKQATTLLLQWLPHVLSSREASAIVAPLAVRLGGWPLLIRLVGAFLGQEVDNHRELADAVAGVALQLETLGPGNFFDHDLSAELRERSLGACVFLCFNQQHKGADAAEEKAGPGGLQARFEELGVFAEDADVPLSTVARLWQHTAGVDRHAVEQILKRLNDFGLFDQFELQANGGSLRLHDVVRSLLQSRLANKLIQLHRALVDSYEVAHLAELPREDRYIHAHLASHLRDAGDGQALQNLLRDPRWLRAKLEAQGFDALLADFHVLGVRDRLGHALAPASHETEDVVLSQLFESLRLSAPTLRRNGDELEIQVLGRLDDTQLDLEPLRLALQAQLKSKSLRLLRPTLDRAGGPLLATLSGHTDRVSGAMLIANGTQAISWSDDSTLKVWDLRTGQCFRTLEGHVSTVHGARLVGDDRLLSWSDDATLRLWNLRDWECSRTLAGHQNHVSGIIILGNETHALSWSADQTLRLWTLGSGELVRKFAGHTDWVSGALLQSDESRVLSWSADKTLRLWDLGNGRCVRVLKGHSSWVSGALLLQDDERALSWSADSTLKLWDLRSGQCSFTLDGHRDAVVGALMIADGRALSWSSDNTLKSWDLRDGQCICSYEGHSDSVSGAVVLADGQRLLSWSADNTSKLWDTATGRCLQTLRGEGDPTVGVQLLPRGEQALSWGWDNTLKLWDIASGECSRTLEGHGDSLMGALLLPDGDHALSWSADSTLKLWDLQSAQEPPKLDCHQGHVSGALVLDDRAHVLSWSWDHTLKLWDLRTGKCSSTLNGHQGWVSGALSLADDTRALSWSEDCTLKLWDLSSGQCMSTLEDHDGAVYGATVLPNETSVLTWSRDKTLKLWDLNSGQCIRTLEGHGDWVSGVMLMPDGRRALSWSQDRTLRLWDLRKAESWRLGEQGAVLGASLLPNGKYIVSWSGARILLWDLGQRQCTRWFEGHRGAVQGALVLPDGKRMLSWSQDNTLRLWDLESDRCQPLCSHTGWVLGALLLTQGRRALSWSRDASLKLWDLQSMQCVHTLTGHNDAIGGAILLQHDGFIISWSKDNSEVDPVWWTTHEEVILG